MPLTLTSASVRPPADGCSSGITASFPNSLCDRTSVPSPLLRWTLGMNYLLAEAPGVAAFKEFLDTTCDSYILEFRFASLGFKQRLDTGETDEKDNLKLARIIFRKYLSNENTEDGQRRTRTVFSPDTIQSIEGKMKAKTVRANLFDVAFFEADNFLDINFYHAFLKSEVFANCLQAGSCVQFGGSDTDSCPSDSCAVPALQSVPEDKELEISAVKQSTVTLTSRNLLATTRLRHEYHRRSSVPMDRAHPYHSEAPVVSRQDSELQSLSSDALTDDSSSVDFSHCADWSGRGVSRKHLAIQKRRMLRAAQQNIHSTDDKRMLDRLPKPMEKNSNEATLAEKEPAKFAKLLIARLQHYLARNSVVSNLAGGDIQSPNPAAMPPQQTTVRYAFAKGSAVTTSSAGGGLNGPTVGRGSTPSQSQQQQHAPHPDNDDILGAHISQWDRSAKVSPGAFSPRQPRSPPPISAPYHHGYKPLQPVSAASAYGAKNLLSSSASSSRHHKERKKRANIAMTKPPPPSSAYVDSGVGESNDSLFSTSVYSGASGSHRRRSNSRPRKDATSRHPAAGQTPTNEFYEASHSHPAHASQQLAQQMLPPSSSSASHAHHHHSTTLPTSAASHGALPPPPGSSGGVAALSSIPSSSISSQSIPGGHYTSASLSTTSSDQALHHHHQQQRLHQSQQHSAMQLQHFYALQHHQQQQQQSASHQHALPLELRGHDGAAGSLGGSHSTSAHQSAAAAGETVVAIYFSGDSCPYLCKLPGRHITLAAFKKLLVHRPGRHQCQFKRRSDDGLSVQYESIRQEESLLPLYDGKIVCHCITDSRPSPAAAPGPPTAAVTLAPSHLPPQTLAQ